MLHFNQMIAVVFSDILGFGLGFGDCGLGLEGHGLDLGHGGCGLVNIAGCTWPTCVAVCWERYRNITSER